MTRITVQDLRATGICRDARIWCAAHGVDWRAFVRGGIEAADLRATGDNLDAIDRLEAAAMNRVSNGR